MRCAAMVSKHQSYSCSGEARESAQTAVQHATSQCLNCVFTHHSTILVSGVVINGGIVLVAAAKVCKQFCDKIIYSPTVSAHKEERRAALQQLEEARARKRKAEQEAKTQKSQAKSRCRLDFNQFEKKLGSVGANDALNNTLQSVRTESPGTEAVAVPLSAQLTGIAEKIEKLKQERATKSTGETNPMLRAAGEVLASLPPHLVAGLTGMAPTITNTFENYTNLNK